jgi:hypothetical protein
VVLQVIASLKIFEQIYLITAGGPNYATRSAIEFIYDTGFTRVSYASAASLALFVVILIVSFIWLFLIRKQERGSDHGGQPPVAPDPPRRWRRRCWPHCRWCSCSCWCSGRSWRAWPGRP